MRELLKYGLPWVILCLIFVVSALFELQLGDRGVGLLIGLISIYYFNLDNPHKSYRFGIIISFLAWVIALQIRRELAPDIGNWLPALAAAILAFVYFQRYQSREDKHWVDVLKLVGVIALLPATYFDNIFTVLIVTYLAFIYLLDRLIIRKQMNKTSQIITFCGLALISISFMLYAFIKANEASREADRAMIIVQENEALIQEVEMLNAQAQQMQQQALNAAAEARMQAALAAEAIKECESTQK